MSSLSSEIDAQFFEMMHRLAGQTAGESHGERRSETRHAYPSLQKIAPYDGETFPEASRFISVQCYDLNASGFSFLFPRKPAFSSLVAALSSGDGMIHVEGQVVQVTRAILHPDGEVELLGEGLPPKGRVTADSRARPALLVGCRFVRRVESP